MPKRKTNYLVWRANAASVGLPDYYGIIAWDVEAWNAAHAARIVRTDPVYADMHLGDETLGVCPSIYFSEH